MQKMFLACFLILVLLAAGCGKPGDAGGEGGAQDSITQTGDQTEPGPSFAGSWNIQGEGQAYTGTLTISSTPQGYYELSWEYDDIDEEAFGRGIQTGGYLGFADAGEGGAIGIYKLQGTEISGLWAPIEGEVVMTERTPASLRLYPSTADLAGTYQVTSAGDDGSEASHLTMTLEPMGNTWVISRESADGFITVGTGLAVDNVLVTGFGVGGSKVLTFYEIGEDGLDGKWLYTYYDEELGELVTVTGREKAEK